MKAFRILILALCGIAGTVRAFSAADPTPPRD